jgi:hypothetical protein
MLQSKTMMATDPSPLRSGEAGRWQEHFAG